MRFATPLRVGPLLTGLALSFAACACAAGSPGASECPCLPSSSPDFVGVPAAAATKGLPSNYGQDGCRAYDKDQQLAGVVDCKNNKQEYCTLPWCYVDMTQCPENKTLCASFGGTLGSYGHSSCRTRASAPSSALANVGNLYYSYATCDQRDLFEYENSVLPQVAGRTLQSVYTVFPPYTIMASPPEINKQRPHLAGLDGILADLVDDFLKVPMVNDLAPIQLNLSEGWATDESRALFPTSSYTACAFDVMLGRTDMCIGDFWVTSQRLGYGITFLSPAYAADDMYLIAPNKKKTETLADILGKPFSPFDGMLWAWIFMYVAFSALVTALTDTSNQDDFENPGLLPRYFKSFFLNATGYVKGGPENTPKSVPARVATWGFGFFCMIVLTSYTANLASLLVAQRTANTIDSIEAAIEARLPLCILGALMSEFKTLYPAAKFVACGDEHEMLVRAHAGDCGAFVNSDGHWMRIASGELVETDCKLEEEGGPGPKVPGQPMCKRDAAGKPDLTRDCSSWKQVGPLLRSIPLSMPLHKMYQDAFSFRMRQLQELGKYKQFRESAVKKVIAAPACVEEGTGSEQGGADLSSMAGTLAISIFCQLLALALCAIETWTGKPIQKLMGFHMTEEDDQDHQQDGNDAGWNGEVKHEGGEDEGWDGGRTVAWSSSCETRVEPLRPEPVVANGGSDVRAQLQAMAQSINRLADQVPM